MAVLGGAAVSYERGTPVTPRHTAQDLEFLLHWTTSLRTGVSSIKKKQGSNPVRFLELRFLVHEVPL